jgi:hypothetical protein
VVVAEQETRPDVVAIEPREEVDETPRRRKRWAWGIAGAAVVVAGVVTAVLVARSGGGTEGPLPGDFGVVITTLGR